MAQQKLERFVGEKQLLPPSHTNTSQFQTVLKSFLKLYGALILFCS